MGKNNVATSFSDYSGIRSLDEDIQKVMRDMKKRFGGGASGLSQLKKELQRLVNQRATLIDVKAPHLWKNCFAKSLPRFFDIPGNINFSESFRRLELEDLNSEKITIVTFHFDPERNRVFEDSSIEKWVRIVEEGGEVVKSAWKTPKLKPKIPASEWEKCEFAKWLTATTAMDLLPTLKIISEVWASPAGVVDESEGRNRSRRKSKRSRSPSPHSSKNTSRPMEGNVSNAGSSRALTSSPGALAMAVSTSPMRSRSLNAMQNSLVDCLPVPSEETPPPQLSPSSQSPQNLTGSDAASILSTPPPKKGRSSTQQATPTGMEADASMPPNERSPRGGKQPDRVPGTSKQNKPSRTPPNSSTLSQSEDSTTDLDSSCSQDENAPLMPPPAKKTKRTALLEPTGMRTSLEQRHDENVVQTVAGNSGPSGKAKKSKPMEKMTTKELMMEQLKETKTTQELMMEQLKETKTTQELIKEQVKQSKTANNKLDTFGQKLDKLVTHFDL